MKYSSGESHINMGTGKEHTIRQLTEATAKAADWDGQFVQDKSEPDGMMRRVMDVGRLAGLGWAAKATLEDGIKAAYDRYVANKAEGQVYDNGAR